MSGPSLAVRVARAVTLPLGRLSERLGNRFYVVLGIVLIAASVYAIGGGYTGGMKQRAYDFIVKSRFNVPPADPDIVIVDIDEASLAAMAPQYGRWPWPRSVMAELLEGLAAQQPRAVVFDITFSDPDVFQPQADRYFRDVVAGTPRSFFPMIRLNPENDAASELKLARLAGVRPATDAPPADATLAAVVPYFFDVLDDRRLGTNNLYPDEDGIGRHYHVYRDVHGWRVYSLPANVVAAGGGRLPEAADILLNWRGRPPAYHTVPFHALYADLLKRKHERPRDEFAGKIVVIGSTAPSLFDIKPTPLSQNHPGVEILATAVDNLKNGDYLKELPRWVYLAVAAIGIGLLTAAFVYNADYGRVRFIFTLVQTGLLVVTYLFLNYTVYFVDLTAPFTVGLAYFFIARTYGIALTMRRNGHPLFSTALDPGRACLVLLLAARLEGDDRGARRQLQAEINRGLGLTRYGASATRIFTPAPLLRDVYQDTLLYYWLVPPEEGRGAFADLTHLIARTNTRVVPARRDAAGLRLGLHAVRFTVDPKGAWRDRGKAALVEALGLLGAGAAPVTATPAFAALRAEAEEGVPLPQTGRAAGPLV